ncbi:putative DNA primase, partial [Lacticaseibacillus paracasei subsp. paracasei CNCM I-4648]
MPTSSQEKQPPKSTKELLALAQDGAKKVFSTDEYREYLKFISGFHPIQCQKP